MVFYNPPTGWYEIPMKDGTVLVRYFWEGFSWLCDPQEFFASLAVETTADIPSLSPITDLQRNYRETCQEMIRRGPVTQYHPANWDKVAELPVLLRPFGA